MRIIWIFLLALLSCFSSVCHAQKMELVVQTGHRGMIGCVAWSSNGQTLASSSVDGTIKLWGKSGLLIRTLSDAGGASSVAWTPDGARLVSANARAIKIWQAATGELLKTLDGFVLWAALSPDGKTIAASSPNAKEDDEDKVFNITKIWDVASGKVIRSLTHKGEGNIHTVAWSHDGKRLVSDVSDVSGSDEPLVKIWEMPSGKLFRTLTLKNEVSNEINAVALSPDGAQVAVATGEGDKFSLWNVQSGRLLRTISTGNKEDEGNKEIEVDSLAWSADGKRLASGHADEAVRVWDVKFWHCRVLRPPVKEEVPEDEKNGKYALNWRK